jgi:hypothetical protein
MFGGQAIVCDLLAAELGTSNRPILARSSLMPNLRSIPRSESPSSGITTLRASPDLPILTVLPTVDAIKVPCCSPNAGQTGDAMRARTSTWGLLRRL